MPGPAKYRRALPPAHYSWTIKPFSVLLMLDEFESGVFESGVFEAGGYKWRLSLYPNGNEGDSGSGYISLYLSIEETDNFPYDWMLHVNYKLFVHDKIRNEFLTIQDADGAVSSFDGSNTRWGFPQFLSLKKFKEPSNGYLVEDSCTFGAEVLVIEHTGRAESFTLIISPANNTFTWKIHSFSKVGKNGRWSNAFAFKRSYWWLWLGPEGTGAKKKKWASVYLQVQEPPPKRKVYVEFHFRVLAQLKGKDREKKGSAWLSALNSDWCDEEFMPWKDVHKFVHDDTLIIEFQIRVISTSKFSCQTIP